MSQKWRRVLEAAMERFEVVISKATSQLDLASLQDHKKYAALRILKWERCILQQVLANLFTKVLL